MTDAERRRRWSAFLRRRMGERGLSVADFGAAAGVSKATAQKWTQGSEPGARFVRGIARALGVSVDDVLSAVEGERLGKLAANGRAKVHV